MRSDVTPQFLAQGLAVVIADDTGCTRAWADHPEPLHLVELEKCFASCVDVFRKCGLIVEYRMPRRQAPDVGADS